MPKTRRYPPIKLGSPGEDISTKDLHAVIQRFKNLNQLRLQRVQNFLQPRQQVFLSILPLLFHQNHPLFPGFICSETPSGIPDYSPNKQAVHSAKQFSKSYSYKRRALINYPIQSLFLMGSVSSIAFSKTSDMDIWLCYQPDMSAEDIDLLQQKASAIEKWADSYQLEAHFFLVNNEQFVKGHDIPISAESSGTTQHYLLLEEFYRTAIYIAGRIPAWWLAPPHEELNYSAYINHLIDNRFISSNEVIDFGGLESIPAEEFISATLWHIYKSLNSPHKSLLKLFLMESYASEYPQPQWLCFELKNAIYQGTFDIDQLDPYLLIYTKVENYLQQAHSNQRLALARQCFYLKIIGASKHLLDYQSRQFRENYLHDIALEWQWPNNLLASLHKQKSWNIKKATQEHEVIRTQLKHSLRMIMTLAGNHADYNLRDNADLKLISRKLHVFLEKKPGKIEVITTRSAVRSKENELTITETIKGHNAIWSLYSGKIDPQKTAPRPIKTDSSLLGLLGWIVINGLYKKQLLVNFQSSSINLSTIELHNVLNRLFNFLSTQQSIDSSPLTVYNAPDKLVASLFFINLGKNLIDERDDGLLVLSDRSDPLSYGKNRHCFIQQIDQISVSKWGETVCSQHIGLDSFFSCLTTIFNQSTTPVSKESLSFACYVPTRAKSIVFRAETIFSRLIQFFAYPSSPQNYRYFLPGGDSYYVFQRKNKRLQYWQMESNEQLMQELASTQDSFSNICFDPEVLSNTVIPFIYSHNRINTIQLFYLTEKNSIKIYIIDERGTLFTQEHSSCSHPSHILNKYVIFLESILNRPFYIDDIELDFQEISKSSRGVYSLHQTKIIRPTFYMDLSLRIVIEDRGIDSHQSIYFIYCNDIEFSSIEYGSQLFETVAQYILDFRKSNDTYPIYISDIEAPYRYFAAESPAQLQTVHYLTIKRKIEERLNT